LVQKDRRGIAQLARSVPFLQDTTILYVFLKVNKRTCYLVYYVL
jgi:hypothetical protein